MNALDIHQLARDILSDLPPRRTPHPTAAGRPTDPQLEQALAALIEEDDAIGKAVMREIWQGLQSDQRSK